MTEFGSAANRKCFASSVGGKEITIETGWVAKQAAGSAIVTCGETSVLVTVCRADARPDAGFFPMVVEYQERTYSAGKIPGGYFKREGKPTEREVLTCRIIDRPLRPMFPDGFVDEVQIIATVLSYDGENQPDVLALTGASAALQLSELPFNGPVGGARIGRVNGEFVFNPTVSEVEKSDLDFIVAATKESLVMVEGGGEFIPENEVLDALFFGHDRVRELCDLQLQLPAGEKTEFVLPENPVKDEIRNEFYSKLKEGISRSDKTLRKEAIKAVKEEAKAKFEEDEDKLKFVSDAVSSLSKEASRDITLNSGKRIDGRASDQVRSIECEVKVLPRTHGSALFTRGETQAIVTATLGTGEDVQRIESLSGEIRKTFLLHYNFPPFCTGEAKMMRSTSRREVGHGNLAERAVSRILPTQEEFPYVIRIVSDIMESNGSSSMASVCGGSLALMDAGVPIKAPVAGVAMGLVKEGDKVAILTDILGDEDHFGDMDFKVCGSESGITALQMDIKCDGLSRETMQTALEQARQGRLHILSEMKKSLAEPRSGLSLHAPVIESFKINPDKIRDVIGPGGKTIKSIVEATGVKIDIQDDGTVNIASSDRSAGDKAKEIIEGLTEEAEIGKIYNGLVKRIVDFGAFVEILPGVEGLVHISQLEENRVKQVSDVISEGDQVPVRVLDIDKQGKIRLSRKEALGEQC